MFRFIKQKNKILFRFYIKDEQYFPLFMLDKNSKCEIIFLDVCLKKKYVYENINTYLIYSCNEKVVYEI